MESVGATDTRPAARLLQKCLPPRPQLKYSHLSTQLFFMILFQPPRTESKEEAERLYWKKVKSPSQREVVEFNGVRSIFTKIMQTAQVVSRADTGERNKIADQMRLVEIALF